ncbi:MAG: hypothetical protein FWG02_06515 [Holophagaceae bacterium]|nr:hypothetical protein [Holophagaceae bacterium]
MNLFHTTILIAACALTMPAIAQTKNQSQNSQATLQRQVKALTEERDALKAKVDDIPFILKQENAELYRQLDEAIAQRDEAMARLEQMEDALRENQSGGDSLLRELQQTKEDLRTKVNRIEELEYEIGVLKTRVNDSANIKEGTLVHLGPDIIPAKCMNLRRMTPSVRKATGTVVVNCLINEMGDPVEVCIIQELSGDETGWNELAHTACLEAAKRLVFVPATTKDGIKVKVWQGVAFQLK